MAQPNNLPPAVAQAIELSGMVGRAMTDLEVAALAVGQLTVSDLVVPMEDIDDSIEAGATAGGEPNDKVQEKEEREIESDEISSLDVEEDLEAEGEDGDGNDNGGPEEEGKMDWMGDLWVQQELQEPQEESLSDSDKPEPPRRILCVQEKNPWHREQPQTAFPQHRPENLEPDESSLLSTSEKSSATSCALPSTCRVTSKFPYLPWTGPQSCCPAGDVSDGEDGEVVADAVPMTKNEEIESILPMGEVSVDEGKVMPVGTILSLVEPDGTIVIRGTPGRPPLAEGSVLFAETQDTRSKKPLGRIHEIFGPCSVPHYTIRVEGAATQHQVISRYQTALHKLLKAEKARADAFKASVIRQEDAPAVAAENGETQEGAPAVAAGNGETQEGAPAVAAENDETQENAPAAVAENGEVLEDTPAAAAENGDIAQAAGQEPAPPRRRQTAAEYREAAQKAAYERRKPSPNAIQKMNALRQTVEEAEKAMGDQKLHPFRRWKVDTAVYVLEKHAKYLAKELLMPCGKGSDASNLNDEEESEEEYFSDDKKERLAIIQKRKEKRRNQMAEQGVLSDEIDAIFKEEKERKANRPRKDIKHVATAGEETRKRVRGRQNAEAEARARGDQGRGGPGTGNPDGTGTHGLEQGGPHSGIGRGGELRGGGDRAYFGGRLGPRGFPAAGPPGQPGHGMAAPGSMGTPGSMPYGVPGFPAWGPPRNGFRGGPPGNVGALSGIPYGMSGTLGPTPQQYPRGLPPGHRHFPSQQYPPPRPAHQIRAANGFASGRGPPHGGGVAVMQGARFQPRFARPPPPPPPPLLPSPHFPPRQQIPNPSMFIQQQQQQQQQQPQHQARPLRFQQPFVGYGAQPVNPVVLPPPP